MRLSCHHQQNMLCVGKHYKLVLSRVLYTADDYNRIYFGFVQTYYNDFSFYAYRYAK